jgi:hypothetical protein
MPSVTKSSRSYPLELNGDPTTQSDLPGGAEREPKRTQNVSQTANRLNKKIVSLKKRCERKKNKQHRSSADNQLCESLD